jgi:hypothetical protein
MDHLHHNEFRWRTLSKYVTWQLSVVSRTLLHGDRAVKCVIHKLMVRRRTAQWGAYDVMSWRWNEDNRWNSHSRVRASWPRFRSEAFPVYCLLLFKRLFWADWNPVARLFRYRTQEARDSNNGRQEENCWAFCAGVHAAGDEGHYVVMPKRISKCQLFSTGAKLELSHWWRNTGCGVSENRVLRKDLRLRAMR